MNERKTLTLADLLCELRQELLTVRESEDKSDLTMLGYIFGMIEDLATTKGDGPTARISMSMYDAVRDSVMGVEWKSTIPTVDEITEAFLDSDCNTSS